MEYIWAGIPAGIDMVGLDQEISEGDYGMTTLDLTEEECCSSGLGAVVTESVVQNVNDSRTRSLWGISSVTEYLW